jgi:hypothetical protein
LEVGKLLFWGNKLILDIVLLRSGAGDWILKEAPGLADGSNWLFTNILGIEFYVSFIS